MALNKELADLFCLPGFSCPGAKVAINVTLYKDISCFFGGGLPESTVGVIVSFKSSFYCLSAKFWNIEVVEGDGVFVGLVGFAVALIRDITPESSLP